MLRALKDKFLLRLMMLSERVSERQLMMILAVVVGIIAGLATFFFQWLLGGVEHVLTSWFPISKAGWLYLVYPGIGIMVASIFVKYIIQDDISEGVTKVLYAMSKRGSIIKPHNCYSSVVGGAMTIGFGGSVGPEAPIVLTGAAIGSNIGRLLKLNYRNITLMLSCGVAAALAAIFKAPITGVIFVMEILMLDITMNAIVPLIISAVTSTTLVFFLKGFDPILAVDVTGTFQLAHLPMYLLLGGLGGLMANYFTTFNGKVRDRISSLGAQRKKWLVGGIVLGVLVFLFPPLYGEGYGAFTSLMHGDTDTLFNNSLLYRFRDVDWVILAYLAAIMFFKVIAMAVTNAAGGVGGTFAPSLFVGAFLGGIIAFVSNTWLGMDLPILSFSLVGMAGVMAGVMKAPLTSIFLIAELSNGYELFVPLMLVASISFAISYYMDPDSIYTKSLRKRNELLTHNKDRSVLVFLNLEKLMETDFTPIREDTTLRELLDHIAHKRRNIFPVLDDRGVLKGVVQLDDLRAHMFRAEKHSNTADQYMIPPPDVIQKKESITGVLDKFESSQAWMLPVVDRDYHYLGFISKSRILAAYREQLIELSQE
ncbi:MAG: chloride channel protein [Tidjanibacter sp.]|nr:chloride channel protein [Tidjanibacter sp.]MBR4064801.1 chloride channel protein [Tidjanibacter sp.]MBR6813261.1 chloride channel protein [Tidjanibacter sp.]MBR7102752.1 chloride channel protein [Tidjanibacter sp.]